MSKGIFGSMFDFNNDGELNFIERGAEFNFIQHLMEEEEKEECKSEIESEGLDFDELSSMDEYERAEVLEAAGLDPDDYEFD